MMSIILEYASNLYDACVSVLFILAFSRCRFRDYKLFSFIAILLSFLISTVYLYISDFSVLQSVLIFAVLIIFSLLLKKGALLPRIIAPFLFEIILILTSTLLLTLFSHLFRVEFISIISEKSSVRYLYILGCKFIITSLLLISVRVFSSKVSFSALDLLLYLVSPIITVLVLYTFMVLSINYDTSLYFYYMLFSILGLMLINVLSLFLFNEASKNAQSKYELELFKKQEEIEKEKYRELKSLYERFSSQRHDFKKQITGIKKLILEKDYDSLASFLDLSINSLADTKDFPHTGDRMIDFIINEKMMENKDVSIHVSGVLEPIQCLSEMDIASLFGNMIDNALEACKRNCTKVIQIIFSVKGQYQNIICKNQITKSVLEHNRSLLTTKQEKELHGYGVKSMRRITEEANGLIDFYEEDGFFCVHIALPISPAEAILNKK